MKGTKNRFSQEKILQDTAILLDNLKNQPIIAEKMSAFKYDDAKIEEGKTLWSKAKELYELTKKENAESTQSYTDYLVKLQLLREGYSLDRKKVKTLYRGQQEKLKTLAVDKAEARSYPLWIADVERFYKQLQEHPDLLKELEAMQMNSQGITNQLKKVTDVIAVYSVYIREKGESQDATKKKDEAFAHLSEWTRTCYAVAKIALINDAQLLESLAKLVKG